MRGTPAVHQNGAVEPVVVIAERDGLRLHAAAMSDTGKVRRLNEDSFLLVPGGFAVADGMGGHNAGEVASRLTIEAVQEWLESGVPDIADVSTVVALANERVRCHAGEAGRDGMGSTLVGAFVVRNADEESVVVVNVGDSRCYLVDGASMAQLTTDHSHVQELVDAGLISPADALTHPERNVVTRAIGVEDLVAGDFFVVPSVGHCRLLLCSDGVSNEVSFEEIQRILVDEGDPCSAAAALLEAVLRTRAADNATAVVIDVERQQVVGPTAEPDEVDITGPRLRVSPPDPDDTMDSAGAPEGDVLLATVPAMQPKSFPPPTVPSLLIDEVP
jgi:protein phosphatase